MQDWRCTENTARGISKPSKHYATRIYWDNHLYFNGLVSMKSRVQCSAVSIFSDISPKIRQGERVGDSVSQSLRASEAVGETPARTFGPIRDLECELYLALFTAFRLEQLLSSHA